MGLLRKFVAANQVICWKFDRLFDPSYRIDGNSDFITDFAPRFLRRGQVIFDVGAGKRPYISAARKSELELKVIGIDISQEELDRAPAGIYDRAICADIMTFAGDGSGDLAICQALLEHVPDTSLALRGIASTIKPGGTLVLFVPCRNAIFARLNLILPESLKKQILFTLFPNTREAQGFRSYYNRCTPNDFREIAAGLDLEEIEFRDYYISSYFSFLFPAYAVWRLWTVCGRRLWGVQAAETFCMAFKKRPSAAP